MIYFVLITLSAFVGYLATKSRGSLQIILIVCSLMFYVIPAGMRDVTVGIDTYGYIVDVALLKGCQFHTAFSVLDMEPLFVAVSWLIVNITDSNIVFLFSMQLLAIVPIVLFIYREHNDSIGTAMLAYGSVFYGFSLSIMRQAISAAFVLLAWSYLKKEKTKSYLFCIIIASGFHNLGILGLLLVIIDWYYKGGKYRLNEFFSDHALPFVLMGAIIVTVLLALNSRVIVEFVAQFKDTYRYQVRRFGEGTLQFQMIGLSIVAIFVMNLISRHDSSDLTALQESLSIMLIGAAFGQFSVFQYSLRRIGYIFWPWCIDYASNVSRTTKGHSIHGPIMFILYLSFLVYFYWVFIDNLENGIYPFKFCS